MRVFGMVIKLPGCLMTSSISPPVLPLTLRGQINSAINTSCKKFELNLIDTLGEKYSGTLLYSNQEFSFYLNDNFYFKNSNLDKALECIQNM